MFAVKVGAILTLLIVAFIATSAQQDITTSVTNSTDSTGADTKPSDWEREDTDSTTDSDSDGDYYFNDDKPVSRNTTDGNTDTEYEDYGADGEGRDGGDDEAECTGTGPTFLDKWRVLYERGKNATIKKHVDHINDTSNVLKVFKENLEFLFKPNDDSRERYKAIEFFSEIDLGLGHECLTAMTQLIMAIGNGEIWALKFIDSMGRPLTSGFAEGLQSNFGEYSECLAITSPKTSKNTAVINGQYCLVKAIMPFPPIHSLNMDAMGDDKQL
ncbi:unnamed protein product, partial [Medioppia subpectinata]